MTKTTTCPCGRITSASGATNHQRRCAEAQMHEDAMRIALITRDWSEYSLMYADRFAEMDISEEEFHGSKVVDGYAAYDLRTGAVTWSEVKDARTAAGLW